MTLGLSTPASTLPHVTCELDVTATRPEQSPEMWRHGTASIGLRAVFLDRDGVINENRADHVKSWAEFRFLPGAPEAIVRLSRSGLRVFVVSNQAIVNRGIVPAADVDAINEAMMRRVVQLGGRIDGIAYCPHRPDEGCLCRKPKPGLLQRLASANNIDLRQTLVVGDAASDLQAGHAAGCATVLVLTGRGRDQLKDAFALCPSRLRVVSDLPALVDLLLRTDAGG